MIELTPEQALGAMDPKGIGLLVSAAAVVVSCVLAMWVADWRNRIRRPGRLETPFELKRTELRDATPLNRRDRERRAS